VLHPIQQGINIGLAQHGIKYVVAYAAGAGTGQP